MKKLVLILVAFAGLHASSLASNQSPQTQADSLAYSLGVDIGRSIFKSVDSTLNPSVIYDGIVAAFSNDTSFMNQEFAQQFIQTYMTVTKPRVEGEKNDKLSKEYLAKMEKEAGVVKSSTGLLYKIEVEGEGEKPAVGDSLFVEFTFYDINGTKIQSSTDLGAPLNFVNQDGSMIVGFLEGVRMLGKGGKVTLYIPSDLGYGNGTAGGAIAPMMALVFEVEMVNIVRVADFYIEEVGDEVEDEELVEEVVVEKRRLKKYRNKH